MTGSVKSGIGIRAARSFPDFAALTPGYRSRPRSRGRWRLLFFTASLPLLDLGLDRRDLLLQFVDALIHGRAWCGNLIFLGLVKLGLVLSQEQLIHRLRR